MVIQPWLRLKFFSPEVMCSSIEKTRRGIDSLICVVSFWCNICVTALVRDNSDGMLPAAYVGIIVLGAVVTFPLVVVVVGGCKYYMKRSWGF